MELPTVIAWLRHGTPNALFIDRVGIAVEELYKVGFCAPPETQTLFYPKDVVL